MSTTTPLSPTATPVPPAPKRANVGLRVGAVITGLLIIVAALNLFQLTVGRDHATSHYAFATGSSTLVLASDSADITVVAGRSGALSVERSASMTHGHKLGAPRLSGDTLQLPGDCRGGALGWLTFCSVHYVVHVPADLALTVRTGSGDLDVQDISTSSLSLKTGSGDLDLTAVTSASISATTGSGDVGADDLVSADTTFETGSGDLSVTFDQDPTTVKASTGSGDLSLAVPRDSEIYTVHQHTGSGDFSNHLVSSDQAPPAGATTRVLTVSTGSGDLSLGYRS
jgi:hypothetical protein